LAYTLCTHSFPTRRSSDLDQAAHLVSHGRQLRDGEIGERRLEGAPALAAEFGDDLGLGLVAQRRVDADKIIGFGATRETFYRLGDRKSTRLNSSHVKISYA